MQLYRDVNLGHLICNCGFDAFNTYNIDSKMVEKDQNSASNHLLIHASEWYTNVIHTMYTVMCMYTRQHLLPWIWKIAHKQKKPGKQTTQFDRSCAYMGLQALQEDYQFVCCIVMSSSS